MTMVTPPLPTYVKKVHMHLPRVLYLNSGGGEELFCSLPYLLLRTIILFSYLEHVVTQKKALFLRHTRSNEEIRLSLLNKIKSSIALT